MQELNTHLTLSVVIATIGEPSLMRTLDSILAGSRVPDEILVCIPRAVDFELRLPEGVTLIRTDSVGQVAQRAEGLSIACGRFVMQVDCDVVFGPNDIAELLSAVSMFKEPVALAPVFGDDVSGRSLSQHKGRLMWLVSSFLASLVGGAAIGKRRFGTVDKSGVGYAIDPTIVSDEFVEVEWLPGGCVICHSDYLIKDDYFPFAGKAYSEDLIHSLLWKKRGVKLYIISNLMITTSVVLPPHKLRSILDEYRSRRYYLQLANRTLFWCRLRLVVTVFQRSLALFVGR